jgi:hypothetical protein
MTTRAVHFEIGNPDPARAASFYGAVFGWTFQSMGDAALISPGAEGGPSGMLNHLGHPPETYVMVYFEVPDIDATLATIEASGGSRMVGPLKLPDGRLFAWFKDPFGNMLGLLTPMAG